MLRVNFKGYSAAPLANLYMQSLKNDAQIAVFNQLRDIGTRENFSVLAQHDNALYSSPDGVKNASRYNYWGQDNKILVNGNGEKLVLTSNLHELSEAYASHEFSLLTGIKERCSEAFFEGGNVFLGKKDGGEKFALIGTDTLNQNCAAMFLKENQAKVNLHSILDLTNGTMGCFGNKNLIAFERYRKEHSTDALKKIADTFQVKQDNVFIISQPNFHIDMAARPLSYPYVLINSPEMAIENLENLKRKFPHKGFESLIGKTKKYYNKLGMERYAAYDVIKKELIAQGFVPIEIGGIYGKNGEINFLNAIVNKRADGTLGYITNSSKSSKFECDVELEKLFERQLKQSAEDIGDVYFIEGKNNYMASGKNSMRYYIEKYYGGIHCMCCEEPDFDIWG